MAGGKAKLRTVRISAPVTSANPARGRAELTKEVRAQIKGLHFPIERKADLLNQLDASGQVTLRGRSVPATQAAASIPTRFFPIASRGDFERKIQADFEERLIDAAHPTSVMTPLGPKNAPASKDSSG